MSDTSADSKADKPTAKKTPHGKTRIATAGDAFLDLGEAHGGLVVGPEGVEVTDAQYQAALELSGLSGSPIHELPEER